MLGCAHVHAHRWTGSFESTLRSLLGALDSEEATVCSLSLIVGMHRNRNEETKAETPTAETPKEIQNIVSSHTNIISTNYY